MKTYWHQHPETIERLTAEYAMGSMPAGARRRMDTLMRERQDITQAVWAWHDTLSGAMLAQQPMAVAPAQWTRLEQRLFQSKAVPPPTKWAWLLRWFDRIPVGGLAVGLMMGLVVPTAWDSLQGSTQSSTASTQLPESYVGVLATSDGKSGLIVSSLRKGVTVDLKQLSPAVVGSGQTLYLWSIDKAGQLHAIAPIPNGRFVSARLAEPAEKTFSQAVELAVSVEPLSVKPTKPSGVFVYRGLCGKLWKPPAG